MAQKEKPICDVCKNTLFNRERNSKYCKKCAEEVRIIYRMLHDKLEAIHRKYPHLKIKIVKSITRRSQDGRKEEIKKTE